MTEERKNQNENGEHKSELTYGIHDKPPTLMAIPLALQNIMAAFSGIVAVPIVVGQAIGAGPDQLALMISATLFASGISTLLQSRGVGPIGSRLPCIMGTDFTFVGPGIAVASKFGLAGYYTATIVGSFTEMILSRFLEPLMRFFPPLVTGIVVTLIGLTMLPVAADWAAGGAGAENYGDPKFILLAMIVMVVIIILNQFGKGFLSSGAVLIGILVGYVVSHFMGLLDFTPVKEAAMLTLPRPLSFGWNFQWEALLAFIPAYFVTAVETIGDLMSVAAASEHEITTEELKGGILSDGVGSFVAGIFNAGPHTSFSQNVGIIPLTGVASRFVVMISGIMLLLAGVFPKLGALVAIMPDPVLGGAGIMMFGMIAVGGLKLLQEVEFTRRNSLVVAVSIGLGLCVVYRPEILDGLPNVISTVFSSGMTTGTITAVLMNTILPEHAAQEA